MTNLSEDIRIKLVTDQQELRSNGHDMPVIELYNDYVYTWVYIVDVSYTRIKEEIAHIKKMTSQCRSRNESVSPKQGCFSSDVVNLLDEFDSLVKNTLSNGCKGISCPNCPLFNDVRTPAGAYLCSRLQDYEGD